MTHAYPAIGSEVPGAVATLRALIEQGNRLILWTVRDGAQLAAAVEWFVARDLELFGVNDNPEQWTWPNDSRKVFADAYIDDSAIGAPLVEVEPGKRPAVCWTRIGEHFGLRAVAQADGAGA